MLYYNRIGKGDGLCLNRKIARLLEPRLQLYFFVLLCFAAASAFFDYRLAAAEGAVVVALYLYYRASSRERRREILKYIDTVAMNVDTATKDTMLNSPLPMVIFNPADDEVIWSNDRFLQITGEREHLFDSKITNAIPGFSSRWLMEGKTECPNQVRIGNRDYMVFGNLVRTDPSATSGRGLLATTYWMDITDFAAIRAKYYATRPVAAIIVLDNYEEIMKNISDNARSTLLSELGMQIDEWAAPANGFLCKYDRDRYLFLFEEQKLSSFTEGKFSLLDAVHNIVSPNGIPATISIGIGKDADSYHDLFQFASLSIEMALSRGGDQVVIKNRFTFEFFGGRTKETEKRTKVKSRVMANALGELVNDSSMIFAMGHRMPDFDSVGAAAGVCAIARKRGRPAYIVVDQEHTLAGDLIERLRELPEYENLFISPQDAIVMADTRSLLVVVDTSRPEQVLSEDLLFSCNRVAVIDHHRRAATYISNATLNFHEPYASSTSEQVTELLQYLLEPSDLLRAEAEGLLAGIMLDTRSFSVRTGSRTFEAAAFLRRSGADTSEVMKYFRNDFSSTIAKYDIIRKAKLYKCGIVIAVTDQNVGRVPPAQAADELLSISEVSASFVLSPDHQGILLSARSSGDVNVQLISEMLGGGGNAASAGAQLPGKTLEEAYQILIDAINQYLGAAETGPEPS